MKLIVTIAVLCATIFGNVHGIQPVACPAIARLCPSGYELKTLPGKCPDCYQCPQVKPAACWDGSWPTVVPAKPNKCQTYYCPLQPTPY